MNSPNNPKLPSFASSEQSDPQMQLEDYLDYLCAPLIGIVPYAQRRRLRLETEDHLLALAEDFQSEGFVFEEAICIALREYGEPWRVGQSFADAWLNGSQSCRFSRFTDAATLRAFGWFGIFTVLTLLLIEWSAFEPNPSSLITLIPSLAVLAPFVAGTMTGIGLAARTEISVCRAVVLLSLVSAAAGLILRPNNDGLTFAAFQFVFWLPAGCLSATVAAGLRRQFQLQGFQRTPRRSGRK
jgi:hypothetical protein